MPLIAPSEIVEPPLTYPLPPLFDAILVNLVDHADAIRVFAPPRNPPSQSVTPTDCDLFASEGVLSHRGPV